MKHSYSAVKTFNTCPRQYEALEDKKVVGFASTYQAAQAKAREMESER